MQANRGYVPPRPPQRMPPPGQQQPYPQQPNQAQAQAQSQAAINAQRQQQEMERRVEEQRKQREIALRPTDRNISEKVADITIGDGVTRYQQLRDMERRLDGTMMQKRLQLMDTYRPRCENEGTLRIWISNTAEGQPWQVMEESRTGLAEDGTFDLSDANQATYRVRIEGRVVAEEDDTSSKSEEINAHRTRMSDFFRAISIDFDRDASLQPDGSNSIEWRRPISDPRQVNNTESSFDTLEFSRRGDEEINMTINLYRECQPPRFKLSPPLADLLDMEEGDTASVIAAIWDYVRIMNLQEDDEHRRFVCDERLKGIFGLDTVTFPQLREVLLGQHHLTDLPPIQLPYTIRLDKEYLSPNDTSSSSSSSNIPSAPTIFDLRVPLPSNTDNAVQALLHDPNHIQTLQSIQRIDNDLAVICQSISRASRKHAFLDEMSKSPAEFIRKWVGSQKRDLEMVLAEGGRGYGEDGSLPDEMRRGGERGVWGSDGVREGVGVWLARAKVR